MGRQHTEPTMVGSSIALLQERFRKLQKVREKREKRELLKLFSESKSPSTAAATPNMPLSFHPEMIFPESSPPPPPQDALSLRLNSSSLNKPDDFRAVKTRKSANSRTDIDAEITIISSPSFENSEVDTSLHL
ncbi:unnamed protein product [Camellia sinensis]|uniref:Uncharacterized protein n=2 Tax=Camellia TaxID=4441 RepID=A0A4V3WJX2_CAMSN|nr:hypothetical protein LOK49_LG06G01195 [Camellia lanceoleosa]THF98596.1 hypothetical protein TEA_013184 [Camellia sinensis var. sinensis]